MILLRSLLLTILAVLAFSAPGNAAPLPALGLGTPVALAGIGDGVASPAFRPCEGRSGKQALPCQPDVGLLAPVTAPIAPTTVPPRPLPAEPRQPSHSPKTDPPPPRAL